MLSPCYIYSLSLFSLFSLIDRSFSGILSFFLFLLFLPSFLSILLFFFGYGFTTTILFFLSMLGARGWYGMGWLYL